MSFDYNPGNLPDPEKDPQNFLRKVQDELNSIQKAARGASNYVQFKGLSAEPSRKYADMLVYADGTNWDPGDGPGLYLWDIQPPSAVYAWNKVGKIPLLGRTQLTADTTLWINSSVGNDANDGTSAGAGAFQTIGRAVRQAYSLDLNGYTLTLQVQDGTYNETVSFNAPFTGMGTVKLLGNTVTRANVVIGSSTGNGIVVQNGAQIWLQGFRVRSGGASGISLVALQNGAARIGALDFNSSGAGIQMYAANAGQIRQDLGLDLTVSAGASVAFGYSVYEGLIYLASNLSYTTAVSTTQVFYITAGGVVAFTPGVTFTGTVTGTKYAVSGGGILYRNGVTIPGSLAGIVTSGVVDSVFYSNNSSQLLLADQTANLSAGYTSNSYDNGTKTASWTPAYANSGIQHFTRNGSQTLGVPTGYGTMLLDMLNGASAGTLTLSAFDVVSGDPIANTNGLSYKIYITTGIRGSHLHVVAL